MHLRSGHTQSCGCYNKDRIKETHRVDISNVRFGKLIALSPTEKTSNRHTIWKCKCDCGNTVEVSINNLQSGCTTSCGCQKTSIGEKNIELLLKENNILYEKEKTFKELKQLRFDFYLPELNRLIEFDGIQHYQDWPSIWMTNKNNWEHRKERDNLKNIFSINNNIPLVRVPYWKRDDLTLEDLLGNKYLIKSDK